ncbi:melanoma-associated antigen E1-like [Littorina saxatilis]|uniref:melanoma-associated antigen E1-like n=1 Tax=Littorina saxatilis TaxID=31220 RepID=UPI0038B666C1
MMTTWMADNSTTNWTVGLKFVQFQKNNSYHSGIKQTPFAALFGADAKIGLTSSSIPNEVLQRLQSEDDLQAALGSPEAGSSTLMLGSPEAAPSTTVLGSPEAASSTIVLGSPEAAPSTIVPGLPTSLLQHEVMDFEPGSSTPPSGRSTPGHLTPASGRSTPGPSTSASGRSTPGPSTSASGRSTPGHLTPASGRSTPGPSTPASGRSTTGSSTPASGRSTPGPSTPASGRSTPGSSTPASGRSTPGPSMSGIDKHKNNILVSRKRAYQAQENQAERMVKRSKRIFPEAEVGDSVTVPIPAVDRGRSDPRNLIDIIKDKDDKGLYTIVMTISECPHR